MNRMQAMKAIVFTRYGTPEVLSYQEVAKPTPKDDEVLIKIHASTVTAGDCELRAFNIPALYWLPLRLAFGITKPRNQILGQEFAGVVEEIGKKVTRFKPGDSVFAPTSMKMGAYAEYICVPEKHPLAKKPENIHFEDAATIPVGGINAHHFLSKVSIKAGDRILIIGAGGCIGTAGVQIAKSHGAHVTVVDSTQKLKALKQLGADELIDYTSQDFIKMGGTYEVIFDVAGKSPVMAALRLLTSNGTYLMGNPNTFLKVLQGWWVNLTSSKKVVLQLADNKVDELEQVASLLANGIIKPLVDRRFALSDVPEAHSYVEKGLKTGNIIVSINPS